MRILGIDPGSHATGYGVIERSGATLRHVAHGTLRPVRSDALPRRLARLQRDLADVIQLHRPEVVSIEQVFVSASARAALVLGQARGVALAAAALLPVTEYAPRQIKQAVTGTGAADKSQVQAMVRRLLGLDRPPSRDAADALAAAICHAHAGRLLALGTPSGRRRPRPARGFVVRRSR